MEIIPRLNQKKRYPSNIEVYPYLHDHHFEGKIILPAVEVLIVLARVVKNNFPQINISYLYKARFFRFLSILPDARRLEVFVDIETTDDGVVALLLTSVKSKTGTISRTVEHARVEFSAADSAPYSAPPFRIVNKLKGNCIGVPSTTIYRDLVPFGTAYQNIVGDLSVSPEGAVAYLSGGGNEADEDLLGSPFPLDAAMHAACVWGQRFGGIVPFPTGFEKRVIYQKTKKGGAYLCRVVPVKVDHESLIFDAWIYDLDGIMFESISGIQMRDVSQGRLRPPDWIKA
jgi:Polyketide synthase dehydratase